MLIDVVRKVSASICCTELTSVKKRLDAIIGFPEAFSLIERPLGSGAILDVWVIRIRHLGKVISVAIENLCLCLGFIWGYGGIYTMVPSCKRANEGSRLETFVRDHSTFNQVDYPQTVLVRFVSREWEMSRGQLWSSSAKSERLVKPAS